MARAVYYNTDKKTFYSASRIGTDTWSTSGVVTGAGPATIGYNERTGEAVLSYLNRSRTAVSPLTLTSRSVLSTTSGPNSRTSPSLWRV